MESGWIQPGAPQSVVPGSGGTVRIAMDRVLLTIKVPMPDETGVRRGRSPQLEEEIADGE